jgi:LysM repeat protein
MRAFLGNGCAKGCLIYIIALILIIAVSTVGLGSLGARFSVAQVQGDVPGLQITSSGQALSVPQGSMASVNADGGSGEGGGGLPLPTSVPPPTIASPQIEPKPTIAPPSALPPPAQGQGGTITGEVSPPFYIVQSGDSLWSIAHKLGIDIDALRATNGITGDIIYPGQVLYLPTGGASDALPSQSQSGQTGDNTVDQSQDPGIPNMPDTGITSRKP